MLTTIIKNNRGLNWLNPMNDDEYESSDMLTEENKKC